MVCAYRARASRWEKPLFVDPWAEALAGADGHAIAKRLDERFAPMELWLTLRVAYLDRLVGQAVDRLSIRQVVILGAGYDTRAARLPRAGVRFFEVDHPATQTAKRARLAQLSGYPVDAATYVTCNFEREDPIEQLAASGFDRTEGALVIWEGVVPYLTEAAVRATATRLAAGLDRSSRSTSSARSSRPVRTSPRPIARPARMSASSASRSSTGPMTCCRSSRTAASGGCARSTSTSSRSSSSATTSAIASFASSISPWPPCVRRWRSGPRSETGDRAGSRR